MLYVGRLPSSNLHSEVATQLKAVLDIASVPHAEAVQQLGRNCHMPNACQTPLHAVIHHEWLLIGNASEAAPTCGSQEHVALDDCSQQGHDGHQAMYMRVIRDALRSGGCCASRASLAGACLGAALGPEAVPAEWCGKCNDYPEQGQLAKALCQARDSSTAV